MAPPLRPVSVAHVRAALELPDFDETTARERMGARPRPVRPNRPWREGAVLLLLFPDEAGELRVLLTRRTDTVEVHRGQLSFPGGGREEGESLILTALRETEEETGIERACVEVLGDLPILAIPPSAYLVRPYVGLAGARPECRPDPREVAGVVDVSLDRLLRPETRREEERVMHGMRMIVPYYDLPEIGEPPLWGATAMILSGFVERIRTVRERRRAWPSRTGS